jgi:cysteine-rich repeat protein
MFGGTKPLGVADHSWRALMVVALLAGLGWSAPALAQCGGTQLCPGGNLPGAGTCTIANSCTITVPPAGLQIDLGSRKLVVKGTLTFAGGESSNVVINAGSFLLDGGTIVSPGADQIGGNVTINLETDATVQNNGLIDVSAGLEPGSVDIEALGGDINFNGRIKANGTTRAADGGFITLFGLNNLTASGMLDASAGDMGEGGEIDLTAQNGAMVVNAPENVAGLDGGTICLLSGTTMQVAASATMMANANGDAGSGGEIDLESGGDMTVLADSDGTGSPAASSQDMQSGGDGADVSMISDNGKLTLNGKIDASAAAGGSGGNLDLEATTDLTFSKQLFAMSSGEFGFGGDVNLFAGGNLSVPQQVNTNGGTGSGGTFEATAGGTLTVSASVITDGTQPPGGATVLQGCTVNLTSSGLISALGPGGTNNLLSSSSMTISGTLKAGTQNVLQYLSTPTMPGTPPTIGSKAVIQPPTTPTGNSSLPCCVNCPVTTTTTTSSTSSTSRASTTLPTTTTTTTLPAGSCGDGHVDPSEQCDDGNKAAGDCCSPTCQFEASGGACTSDNNPCTSDVCNATGVCTHAAGNAGTMCRPAAGACDAAESCTGQSPNCPPDVAATSGTPCRPAAGDCDLAEVCDGTSKACPADAKKTGPCRPSTGACDVAESCDGVSNNCPPDAKEPNGTSCAPDACTTAVCSGGTCTAGTEVTCPTCQTCDPGNGACVVGPRPSCTLPVKSGKSKLGVKISSKGPKSDQVLWNWVTGGATTTSEFGNPLASDSLAFCLFDRSQATPSLLFSADVAGGGTCGDKPCWKASKDKGFTFASKTGNADGVIGLKLISGLEGKASIQLKGKGLGLSTGPRRPSGLPQPPLHVPLTAQLQADNGACWEANFSSAGVNKNDTKQFSGNAD